MKIKVLRAGSFVLGLLLLALAPAFAQFRVIGYLPSWTGDVNAVQYSKLTHINYAFLLPNADGSIQAIDNPAKLQSLVAKAHAANVKVLISVGGWMDGNPAPFESIGANAGYTSTFTTNLVNFANQYGLDGIDIDWEHPNANTANAYANVMQKLAIELHSRGKLLTTAVAGGTWAGPGILPSVYANLDFMNIMAYDDTPPNHSTYALASQSITYWQGQGLPKSKTVLGVPFYAQPSGTTYADLLTQGASPNADLFNNQGYNGIPTIKSKTNLAFDQASGIMIWQLAGDAVGANSLLTAINQVVLSRATPPPSSGVATFYKECSYTGTAVGLPVGDYTLSALQAKGILNDDISSLQLNSGYQVVLYENDNYSGNTLTLTASTSCLVNNALGTGNWNDKTTSLRVQAVATSFSKQLEAEAANVNNGMTVETCTDAGGGQDMGYIDAGDYLVWTNLAIPTTGTYLIEYRVASGASGGTISADLNAGSIQLGSTSIPATGGWQNWTTVSRTVSLTAGTYNFGVYAQTGGYNVNWVRLTKQGTARLAAPVATGASPQQAGQVTLYPNPVANGQRLQTEAELVGSTYQVVDLLGRVASQGTVAAEGLDVSALRPGQYTLLLTAPTQERSSRHFTKQ
jgi:chitinase